MLYHVKQFRFSVSKVNWCSIKSISVLKGIIDGYILLNKIFRFLEKKIEDYIHF